MSRFLLYRVLLLVPTLLGVLLVTFLLLYVAPGDPVQAMVGERADPETLARLRAELRWMTRSQAVRALRERRRSRRPRHQLHHARPILRDLLNVSPPPLRLAGAAHALRRHRGNQHRGLRRVAPRQWPIAWPPWVRTSACRSGVWVGLI